ncbi:MAG: InlB B-repeat-containing protein, partial [Candidatus Enterousia sp.]
MGQLRRFLGIFVSLFIIAIAGNAHAAGYTCDSIKQYESCNPGYYMNLNGSRTNYSYIGNQCSECSVGKYCTGGTTDQQNCPANTYRNATKGTDEYSCSACATGANGQYSTAGSTSCTNIVVSVSGNSLTYNGSEQACGKVTVTTPSSGASVTYSTSSTGTFSSTQIKKTAAGTYNIYYQVSYSGSVRKTGSYTCTVSKAACTLAINKTTSSIAYPNSGTFTVSNNKGSVTVSSSATGVATTSISGSTVTNKSVKPGSATITVTDPGNANYNGCSKTHTVTVTKGTNPIALSATSGSTAFPATKTFTVSNAQGTVTVSSNATGVATAAISGTTVTMTPVATGSATITATAAGNDYYNQGSKTYTLTVNKGTISATKADKSKVYDGSALTCNGLTVSAPSSTTIKYCLSKTTSACTPSSTTVPTVTNVADSGTVYYSVEKANYTTATGNFKCTVTQADNPITLSASSGTIAYPNSGTFTVSKAQGAVTVSSGTTTVATASISGSTVTVKSVKPGSSTITVTAAGNTNYKSGSKTYAVTVVKGTNPITLSESSGSTAFPATKTFTVSNAQGTVTVSSNATGVATAAISGTTVTMTPVATGSATITATAAGNDYYNQGSKTYTLTVNKGTISATKADKSKVYDGSALTCNGLTVSAPSSTTIKYCLSKTTSACTPSSTTVPTVTNVADSGTVYYSVEKANYTTATGNFKCTIIRAAGSITAIADQTLTYPSTKTVTVTRTGDGAVSASSSDTTVATVSVSDTTLTLTPKKYGTATITVNVAQGSNHDAATPVTFKVTVNRGSCTVTLSRTSSTVTYPTNPTTFTATATGNGAFNTPGTSNASVVTATISNGTITPVTKGAGSATITISTAQTDQYNSCSAKHTVTVDKAAGQVVINPTSGSIAYRPGAAASTTTTVTTNKSGGTISATSNNTNITTGVGSDGKTITITSNGNVLSNATVTVTSATTTNYNSASTTYTLSRVTCGDDYYNKNGTCTACPENATACGGTSNPDTFDCDAGYTKNAAGDACEPAEYTVTYNCGTGTGTPPTETTKPKYNASTGYTPKDNTCTKAGYDFAGWLVSDTSDIREPGTKFIWKYTQNKTFTAQWDAIGNYSATYSCGDGDGTAPAKDTNITFNDSYTVKANGTNNCTRTGYDFAGWSDGSKTVSGTITWTYTTSKTFTAQWTPKCLPITVDSQNATINAAPTTVYLKYENGWYSNNTCTTALSAFTTKAARTGHTFDGFYTGTTGTGTQVVNTTGNGTFITSATALKAYSAAGTMYAKWTINTYTISYILNGGTNASSGVPTSYTYGVGATINGKPTRANYLFAGWCTDSGLGSCSMTQTINTTATGNKTFYAKWNGCPDHATCTNNTVTCDENYNWNEAIQTCVLGTLQCVAGKYYPGTGTTMADCKSSQGWYCPGTGSVAIGGGVGCRVTCPTSKNNGTLTTSKDNATELANCVESLSGVQIPKDEPQKNGTANTVCKYTGIVDGAASYNNDCQFTVTSCIAGYYVPIKDATGYTKQGYCEAVGKGYWRAEGTCNANPTSANDTCMRNACPTPGTTSIETASQQTQCHITCSQESIKDGSKTVGTRTPVKATLDYSGSAYPSCTYTLTCIEGYKKQGENTAAATCVPEVYTVTLNINYEGGTNQAAIYAKHNHGWYSNAAATTAISKITPPTRTNYDFAGYQNADGDLVINSDGTFVEPVPTLTANITLTAIWHGIPVTCVAGKYYTGTGTTMADCRSGEYCPGAELSAYQGAEGCFVKCPKSVQKGTLSSASGATSVTQCKETLTNVQIPKDKTTKNGTADTLCGYSRGEDGSATYEEGCEATVKSCIAGYYVPIKDATGYTK